MMTTDPNLQRIISSVGSVRQLVLFGSRAADVARSTSDWDVLVVHAVRVRSPRRNVDVVSLRPEQLSSDLWLGSELAGHVAHYGIWLVGEPDWTTSVTRSNRAIQRKATRIVRRATNLQRQWKLLDRPYRLDFARALRRDIQRCLSLVQGEPVAPTKVIDERWRLDSLDLVIPTLRRLTGVTSGVQEFLSEIVDSTPAKTAHGVSTWGT
jgi:hypothetical protein